VISGPQSITDFYAEGQRYFMGEGQLHNALSRLVGDLESHHIDYVVIGALALLAHGYRRFTEVIDLILTPAGLEKFQQELIGLGYAPAFARARKRFRSTHDGTPIEMIASGECPGDGKPKPISFPNPSEAIDIDGIKFLSLEKLVELKLASGMTASDRLKDLADVQELIKVRGLPDDFAQLLNPYVREKYQELVRTVTAGKHNNFEE